MLIISLSQFPDVNEETKMLIKEWGKVITNKYKDIEKDYNLNEEMFCNEPLLVIDYDQFGLERRKITDSHVAKNYSLTSSEIPYDNYCYYSITSDLSTISDVSISSISNALSDNNNSSEIPYDNHR
ncbi:17982_t:CDS:2 [Rhizophagus irregularis]|nr:17982_t:CDS:2 [Rhizophagus irregularis]